METAGLLGALPLNAVIAVFTRDSSTFLKVLATGLTTLIQSIRFNLKIIWIITQIPT